MASGHAEEAVDAVLEQTFRTKPDVKQRVYMICSRGDALQVLQPDADVPDFEEQMQHVRYMTRTKKTQT